MATFIRVARSLTKKIPKQIKVAITNLIFLFFQSLAKFRLYPHDEQFHLCFHVVLVFLQLADGCDRFCHVVLELHYFFCLSLIFVLPVLVVCDIPSPYYGCTVVTKNKNNIRIKYQKLPCYHQPHQRCGNYSWPEMNLLRFKNLGLVN